MSLGTTDRPPHVGPEIVGDTLGILKRGEAIPSSSIKLIHDYKVITAPWYGDGVLRVCSHCGEILGFKRLGAKWELLLKGDGSCA